MNPFQMMLLYRLSKENRTSDLAHTFDVWSPASYFSAYSDHLLLEWFLGGMFAEMKPDDLMRGYNDKTLVSLVGLRSPSNKCPNSEAACPSFPPESEPTSPKKSSLISPYIPELGTSLKEDMFCKLVMKKGCSMLGKMLGNRL